MGVIHCSVVRWLTEAGAVFVFVAVLTSPVHAQVTIRDTIRINPQPLRTSPGSAAQEGSTLRLVLTQSGNVDLRPSGSHVLWMINPCGEEKIAQITGSVTTVEVSAKAGGTAAMNSFRVLQSPTMNRSYASYLDGDLIDSVYLPGSCPVACLFQGQIGVIVLYSSFQIGIDYEFGESSMFYGQLSENFVFQYSIQSCSSTVWSQGSRTTISITEGAEVGTFVNAAGEEVGDEFTGTGDQIRQLRFLANGNAVPGTNRVVVQASSRGITSSHTIEVFKPEPAVHHFELTVSPDTIHHGQTGTLFVKAKDAENQNVELSDGAMLQLFVGVEQRQYGVLGAVVNDEERKGTELSGIPYGTARTGGVVYIADGENPIGMGPQSVPIGVQWMEDATVGGLGTVVVECKVDPPRYAQGDSRWGGDWYDRALESNEETDKIDTVRIGRLGCALSSMAMAMTAFGDTTLPGQLNSWMKERTGGEGGFFGRRVNWGAMALHSGSSITSKYLRKQMWKDSTRTLLDSTQITPPTVFDEALSKCSLGIAQVYNSNTRGEHWIVVSGKKQGKYVVLDPGGRNEGILAAYGSFWSYVIVTKSEGESQ